MLHDNRIAQVEPKRLDCQLQHGGESDIEHLPRATEDASRFDGFHHPFFAELHIRPSREAVLLVPGTFAVPQQYDSLHLLQPPVSHPPEWFISVREQDSFHEIRLRIFAREYSAQSWIITSSRAQRTNSDAPAEQMPPVSAVN